MGKTIRHFVGSESSKQLAFIDDLHTLGLNNTVELPELVVVGDQNTGKSSVLQAITEISFPVEGTMCTRFPIKISFRNTSEKPTVKATILPGPISQHDDALMERTKDFVMENEELTTEIMEEIVREATTRIFGADEIMQSRPNDRKMTPQPTLSDTTLRIERSGPDERHWTIVDLPGLVQTGQPGGDRNASQTVVDGESKTLNNATIAQELVRSFLSNERNIVLVVVDSVDVERHRSLKLIEEMPGLQSRSIGVLTKCDLKQETSDRWMIKLLRNELSTVRHLDHGWFGLRNRKPKELDITDEERDENERKEFSKTEWEGVPNGRTGIKSLMTYVDKERRSQLQKSMPQIIAEIRENLKTCEINLKKLGEVRNNPAAQRHYAYQFCIEMQQMAEAALRGRYEDIPLDDAKKRLRYWIGERLKKFHGDMVTAPLPIPFRDYMTDLHEIRKSNTNPATWEEVAKRPGSIYSEIYEEAKICQATSLPGTIHPDVEERIFRRQSEHWKYIAANLIEDVKNLVRECNDVLLRLAIPDSKTRMEVISITANNLEEWSKEADAALEELMEDHQKRPLITHNPTLKEQSDIADQGLRDVLYKRKVTNNVNGEHAATKSSSTADGIQELAVMSVQLSLVFHVRARLETYYKIALYRFIDNVAMQVVERHVLGPHCPLRTVSVKLFADLSDEDLNKIAGEDEATSRTRARLVKEISRYQQALAKWGQIRSL